MKPLVRNILAGFTIAACSALLVFVDREREIEQRPVTCSGVTVTILDSAKVSFVTVADVKGYIQNEAGPWLGQKPDSIKLWQIEEILSSKPAIRNGEAYFTGAQLHVDVMQREPAVKFSLSSGESFYADPSGFIFPLQPGYRSDVPVVEGNSPLVLPSGFKGRIDNAKGRAWLGRIIYLASFINEHPQWKALFPAIEADREGNLRLKPAVGEEIFIFGQPLRVEDKFSKIKKYYEYIAVQNGERRDYKTVNISFKGQIICSR